MNNPVRYTDPTGHSQCQNQEDCADIGLTPYEGIWKMPKISDPEDRNNPTKSHPNGFIQPTIEYYGKLRLWLVEKYQWTYVDRKTGKIDDVALMAFITLSEFGILKKLDNKVYEQALGALSNQYIAETPAFTNLNDDTVSNYSNIQCGNGGPGCTLGEQVAWLSDMQGWYDGIAYEQRDSWVTYIDDAARAAAGIPGADKWFWGNTSDLSPYTNYVYTTKMPSGYGKYFVVYGGQISP